jgi:hypothetical protein
MFIDSDRNTDISAYSDDNFLNHPGFIGGTWFKDVFSPGQAEEERYQEEVAKQKNQCYYEAGDSCVDLYDCREHFQHLYDTNTGNTRVPKRIRKAANYHRGKVDGYIAARDCNIETTVTSAIDTSQEEVVVANNEVSAANEELSAIRDDLSQITSNAQQAADRAAAQLAAQQAASDAAMAAQNRDNQAAIAQIAEQAEADKQAASKRNMMIMYGAGVVVLLLILKK